MMRCGGGMVYRNQKVLQVKNLEPTKASKEYPLELCEPKPMPLKDEYRDKPPQKNNSELNIQIE